MLRLHIKARYELAAFLLIMLLMSCLSFSSSRYEPVDLHEDEIIQTNTNISFENLIGLDGYSFDQELIKNRYVLINFWDTWCPYCETERLSLQLLHEINQDNFFVLTISLGEEPETVRRFMIKNNYTFPVLLDTEMTLKAEFARFVPMSYIMNPDGLIIAKIEGNKNWSSAKTLKVLQNKGWYKVSSNSLE
jgi:thiol-disulfide isomerase/thioredoxin